MSLYTQFETDADLETKGFALEIIDGSGTTTFILARAGGKNREFTKYLQQLMKPHQRAASRGTLKDEIAEQAGLKAISRHVVLAWENVKDRNGNPLDYSEENCFNLLTDLPDLADFLLKEANNEANFLMEEREEDAKS